MCTKLVRADASLWNSRDVEAIPGVSPRRAWTNPSLGQVSAGTNICHAVSSIQQQQHHKLKPLGIRADVGKCPLDQSRMWCIVFFALQRGIPGID